MYCGFQFGRVRAMKLVRPNSTGSGASEASGSGGNIAGGAACIAAPPIATVRDRSNSTLQPQSNSSVANRIKQQLDDLHTIRGEFLKGALNRDLRAYFSNLMDKKPEIAMNFLKGIMPRDMDTVVGGQERASVLIIRAESGSQVAVSVDAA